MSSSTIPNIYTCCYPNDSTFRLELGAVGQLASVRASYLPRKIEVPNVNRPPQFLNKDMELGPYPGVSEVSRVLVVEEDIVLILALDLPIADQQLTRGGTSSFLVLQSCQRINP